MFDTISTFENHKRKLINMRWYIKQVVNHGVSKQVMRDMEQMCDEFFRLPAADKASLYSEDTNKPNRLYSGVTYDTGGEKYWRDCLRLAYPFPVNDSINEWPDNPKGLR